MSNALTLVLLVSALIASAGFVAVYSTRRWQLTSAGKSTMLLSGSLCLLVIFGMLNVLLGEYTGREAARFGIYALINIALWRQLIVLVKARNRAYRDEQMARSVQVEDKHSVI